MSRSLVCALIALFFTVLAACGNPGPLESAGEAADEAIEEAGETIEEAGDEIEDKTDG